MRNKIHKKEEHSNIYHNESSLLDESLVKDVSKREEFLKTTVEIIISLGSIGLFLMKFINYIILRTKFNYYMLNSDFFFNDLDGFVFNIILIICCIMLFFSIPYLFVCVVKQISEKKSIKESFKLLFILILYFLIIGALIIYFLCFYNYIYIDTLYEYLINIIIISFIALLLSFIAYFYVKLFNLFNFLLNNKKFSSFVLYVISFALTVLILSCLIRYECQSNLEKNLSYYLIDDNTVVVHTSEDYYLTLDCKIDEDESGNVILTIIKNTQNKIPTNNVKTYIKIFDNVGFVDELPDEVLFLEEDEDS